MEKFGEQGECDHSTDGEEGNPRRPEQSPSRIADDRYKKRDACGAFRLIDTACREQHGLSRSGEKRVRIVFR